MKWCRFQVRDKVSYDIVEDETRVIEVSGTPFETYTVTATKPRHNFRYLYGEVTGSDPTDSSPPLSPPLVPS